MRTLVVVAVLLLGLGMVRGQGDAPSEAPYLYYYSDVLNAFVIERADGSDSRMIGQNIMPEVRNLFTGPGWSPSGDWFAWTAYKNRGAIGGYTGPTWSYVVSTHTGEVFDPVNGLEEAILSWSPQADYLLVIDPTDSEQPTEVDGIGASYRPSVTLYNMQGQEVVLNFSIQVLGSTWYTSGVSNVAWSSDGRFLVFYYRPYNEERLEFVHAVIVTLDGRVEEYPLDRSPLLDPYQFPELPSDQVVRLLEAEHVIAVHNPITDESYEIAAPFENWYQLKPFWNSTGDYGLIYERVDYPRHRLWLISLEERSILVISDDTEQVSYFYPVGSSQFSSSTDLAASWSPDGRQFVYRDADGYYVIYDVRTEQFSRVPEEIHDSGRLQEVSWSLDRPTIRFNPAYEYTPGANAPENERPITGDYDVETGTIVYTPLTVTFYNTMHYASPNGRYVTRVSAPSITEDTWTGEVVEFPIHSGATVLQQAMSWDTSSGWLIKGEANFLADGTGYRLFGVTNVEGTYWRELTGCYFTSNCLGWLSLHVDVSQLPTGSAESVLLAPIEFDRNVEYSYGIGEGNAVLYCDLDDKTWKVRVDGEIIEPLQVERECDDYERRVFAAISPDRRLLIFASSADLAEVWNIETGERVMYLNVRTQEIKFSEDGTRLYTRSRRALLVWDVNEILRRTGIDDVVSQ